MARSSQKGTEIRQEIINAGSVEQWQEDSLQKALDAQAKIVDVVPDDARSKIQSSGKEGWCYIGDDRNFRICSEIGKNDTCMSGDVFPSQEICMNPNLRA
jgi:hypothetical protein